MVRLLAIGLVMVLAACGKEGGDSRPPTPSGPRPEAEGPRAPAVEPPAPAAERVEPAWAKVSRAQIDEARRLRVPVAYEEPTTGMRFVLIPGGTFQMGSRDGEGQPRERPQHAVTLSPYYLSIHETTNAQYKRMKADHDSIYGVGDTEPVRRVSHDEATAYAAWLDGQGAQKGHALPTEAQWEYACRAGSTTQWSFGDDEAQLKDYAWYGENGVSTHPVGEKKPNTWGLYDMHGNVWEWCADDFHDDYKGAPANGSAWIDSPRASDRVYRGGSESLPADALRSSNRSGGPPDDPLSFRLARSVTPR